MGNISLNNASVQQQFQNSVNQIANQSCTAQVQANTNNNQVIINGGIFEGNVTGVSTQVSTDASCSITSSFDAQVQNAIKAIVAQTIQTETSWFNAPGFQDNTFNINQTIVNNINQVNNELCAASTVTSSSNNYVYVAAGATVSGNFIGITNAGQANATCSMTNYMKSVTYNQAQAQGTQTNTIQSIFGGFFAIIITIAIIGAIVAVVTVVLTSITRANRPPATQNESNSENLLSASDINAIEMEVLGGQGSSPASA